MSKTIYYLGAGASYGSRDKDTKSIIEGIPVVAEIPKEFDAFRNYIANAVIPSGKINFWDMYLTTQSSVEQARQYMLGEIDRLLQGIKEHATIDTYARKLYLTKRILDFEQLKTLLCAFFVWEQLEHKPDGRYDTFLANVLDEQTLDLPEPISIISWNYDSQIEMAFEAYRLSPGLPIYEKNIQGKWPQYQNKGLVFKVNGSATFADAQMVSAIKNDNNTSKEVQLIQVYSNTTADTTSLGFQFKTHLSFAWEESTNKANMNDSIKEATKDTEQVVVIGYSFPFFNRVTDRQIFHGMENLKKVYIQDINPTAVSQSIQAVLPTDRTVDVVPISNCSQFYLPNEL